MTKTRIRSTISSRQETWAISSGGAWSRDPTATADYASIGESKKAARWAAFWRKQGERGELYHTGGGGEGGFSALNLIQSLFGVIRKEEKPLHVGEVMTLWSVSAAFEEGRMVLQMMINHTTDPELKRYMVQYVQDFDEPWNQRLKKFMTDMGVPHAPPAMDKSKADEKQIPGGAKMSDEEICLLLAAKIRSGLQLVQTGILQCLRYDLGIILIEIELAAYRQALVLREIMDNRGWLRTPPLWHEGQVSSTK